VCKQGIDSFSGDIRKELLATIKKRLPKKYHLATRIKETSPKKKRRKDLSKKIYTDDSHQKHIEKKRKKMYREKKD